MHRRFFSCLLVVMLAHCAVLVQAAPVSRAEASTLAASQRSLPNRVNLNTADAETFKRELSGIGRTRAEAIVRHRETYGPFDSVDELLEVKGIGKALFDRNREKLAL